MTNTELLCLALGWQGGTVHQVAKETGLTPEQIINTDRRERDNSETFSQSQGWMAIRTCSLDFNQRVNFPNHKGDLNFWMGVARGMEALLEEKSV